MTEGALLIVSADVLSGKDEEFNLWYNDHHIPEFSNKMPYVKTVRRYFSKRGTPSFIAVYEYNSWEDLKRSIASKESNDAGLDADIQVGILVKSFTCTSCNQIFP